jgi:putative membrane protein
VFLAVLVHVSGAIGMSFYDKAFFVSFTPVNLLLMLFLLIWNEEQLSRTFMWALLVAALTGIASEMTGVHTGLLFGHYQYGEVLGFKFMDVPLLIGLNWFCIVYCAYLMMLKLSGTTINRWLLAAGTGLLATLFDWIMEPVAVELGFWKWENDIIPVYNFFCWWLISTLLGFFFYSLRLKAENPFAVYLFIIQFLFFFLLQLLL